MVNSDFRELLAAFSAAEVRFLVVGGYAVTFHAQPRFTKDLDVWVEPTAENSRRTFAALLAFGAPLSSHGVSEQDFSQPGLVYQMGLPPNRIDVLTAIEGLEFGACWDRRVQSTYGNAPVAYLSRQDLIVNKRKVGRPQDLEDVRNLEDGS